MGTVAEGNYVLVIDTDSTPDKVIDIVVIIK
jgi:hypothetical protein